MATKKRKQVLSAQQPLLLQTTETEAGLEWLHSLPEDQFRDRVLQDLFRRMKSEGLIDGFENIHGRNDKGVDYLVASTSIFGSSFRGVQVKSKRITRSESGSALSAIRIREECEAAMNHDFHFQGQQVRIQNIDVWSSAPVTEDAEKELNPPHRTHPIGLKKDREILSLVEKYCPGLLDKIPQFAVAKYIADSRSPQPKAVRILGCNLNPSQHFIEPFFSPAPAGSAKQMVNKDGALQPVQSKLTVKDIVDEVAHTIIFAPPLSGRSYLLEHLKCKLAANGRIPVLLNGADLSKTVVKLENIIANKLGAVSVKQVTDLAHSGAIVVLIDDADRVTPEAREKLFALESKTFRIIAAARSLLAPAGARTFYLSGVDWPSVVGFLRSVDNKLAAGKPFVDRAKVFIDRAFESSGLPKNPFTIAVMLEECQHSVGKFSTPTMGRLIGRFIELQLGSHTDATYVVDFETKREFLTRLAGHSQYRFSIHEFEKILGKYIDLKGHPHSITDFSNDLLHSGIFQRLGDAVEWAHPVIKEFFWVKNLIGRGNLKPIQKRLGEAGDPTLAALAGSQMEDAQPLFDVLLPRLRKVKIPTFDELISSHELGVSLSNLISDQEEESLLTDIENGLGFKNFLNQKDECPTHAEVKPASPALTLTSEHREALKKRLEPVIKSIAESELHIATNVVALLLNARATKRTTKEEAVEAVLCSCELLGKFTNELIGAVYQDSRKLDFLSAWLTIVMICGVADEMLGDPHLVSVFRGGLRRSKSRLRTLVLLDLLLCCGEDESKLIMQELENANHLGITLALYWRVAMLYYFRFHRDVDRNTLRKLLAQMRKMERGVNLPKLV
jgi:hypothetical protein